MNNFFKKESLILLSNNIKGTILKFPLSFIAIFIVTGISEYLVFQNRYIDEWIINTLGKILLSLGLFYFLSIWIYLFTNRQKFFELKTCILQFFWILFSVFFYFGFPEILFDNFYFENLIYISITFLWVISFVFVSRYLWKLRDKNLNISYYSFFNWIYSKFSASVLVWFTLMFLWFIALWSIFSLFDLKILISEGKSFSTWSVFSLLFFAPIYFLYQIKWDFDWLSDKIQENKFYNFINNYLSIPFIIIYFIILYSYTIKVLLNFNSWPEGIISWMIILFSLFWYLIYIFSYVFEEKNSLVRIFRKIFPFAVILQVPMLFYAIYLRINQYDLTMNRYLVLVFWFFLVFISLYLIFSKKKLLISIPLILTFFIIILSVWPWWVYNLPESRQLNLLKNDLIKSGLLINWKINLSNKINKELSNEIYWKIDYLCEFHSCYSMSSVFWDLIKEIEKEHKAEWEKTNTIQEISPYYINNNYRWINNWELKTKLLEKLKINPYNIENKEEILNFSLKYDSNINNLVNITKYNYLLDLSENTIINNESLYSANLDTNKKKLIIYKKWNIYIEYDLSTKLDEIYNNYKEKANNNYYITLDKPIEIEARLEKMDIKLILKNFSLYKPDCILEKQYNYTNWNLLILEK